MSDSEILLTTEKIQLLNQSDDKRSATFIIEKEDHTIGNLLRFILMKDLRVEYAAYSIPHPSDELIHLRIQSVEIPAVLIFDEALTKLIELTDYLSTSWDEAVMSF